MDQSYTHARARALTNTYARTHIHARTHTHTYYEFYDTHNIKD